ncbi:MAG: RIP metalloprotease RseP [Candidatus Paceibacterota bacterium]
MSVILFIAVLAVLILVHELGHFLIAKWAGIRVDEFGLGFPPKLWGKQYGETVYSLNAIPFGGFVKIHGETPDEAEGDGPVQPSYPGGPDAERSLVNKSKPVQAAVMVGGVFFNFLLAWLLFSVGFMSGLPMSAEAVPTGGVIREEKLTIVQVMPDSPADGKLAVGDRLWRLSTETEELTAPLTATEAASFIHRQAGQVIDFHLNRGGEELVVSLMPVAGLTAEGVAVGISLDDIGLVSLSPWRAVMAGAQYTAELTVLMVVTLGQILTDLISGSGMEAAVVGPVGIVGLVGDAASLGIIHLLIFTALISVNLAIINLIPFPALDGGRLLFIAIEAVKGSPIPPKVANTLNLIGFSLLILLMLFVTYKDIMRLLVG